MDRGGLKFERMGRLVLVVGRWGMVVIRIHIISHTLLSWANQSAVFIG